jgi:hypothetical protein
MSSSRTFPLSFAALSRCNAKATDTPAMAFHRGRIDLLQDHLDRDPSLLEHRFQESEIFPAELGIKPGDGLHVTPVTGGALLHLAIE